MWPQRKEHYLFCTIVNGFKTGDYFLWIGKFWVFNIGMLLYVTWCSILVFMIEDVFVSVVRIDRIISTQSHSLLRRIFYDLDSTKLSRVRCSIILVKMDRAPTPHLVLIPTLKVQNLYSHEFNNRHKCSLLSSRKSALTYLFCVWHFSCYVTRTLCWEPSGCLLESFPKCLRVTHISFGCRNVFFNSNDLASIMEIL